MKVFHLKTTQAFTPFRFFSSKKPKRILYRPSNLKIQTPPPHLPSPSLPASAPPLQATTPPHPPNPSPFPHSQRPPSSLQPPTQTFLQTRISQHSRHKHTHLQATTTPIPKAAYLFLPKKPHNHIKNNQGSAPWHGWGLEQEMICLRVPS